MPKLATPTFFFALLPKKKIIKKDMPFSALAPRGAFADVRRAFTYNCSSDFCDGVLPKLKDSVFFSLRTASCALVERAVRHAFDTWSYNSDLRFAQVDGDADFYLLAQDLNHDADGHVLGQACPRRAAGLGRAAARFRVVRALLVPGPPVLPSGAPARRRPQRRRGPRLGARGDSSPRSRAGAPRSPLGAALRILAWVGFLGVPLALVAGLPCWACSTSRRSSR